MFPRGPCGYNGSENKTCLGPLWKGFGEDIEGEETTLKAKKTVRASRSRRIEMLQIYSLMIPVFILIFIFSYIPLYGIVIAFQDYVPGAPFLGEGVKWVGLEHFIDFIQGEYFGRLIRNTLVLSGLNLLFGFTAPILFALLMDQIGALRFKKLVQTASYMPYFISTVVVAGMVISFIDNQGLVTNFLTLFGFERQNYRINPDAFPATYTITNVWKGFGFGSILYFSTISSIDQGL